MSKGALWLGLWSINITKNVDLYWKSNDPNQIKTCIWKFSISFMVFMYIYFILIK